MYTDLFHRLSNGQSVTATAWSENVINLTSNRDIGAGEGLKIQVTPASSLTVSSSPPAATDIVTIQFDAYTSSSSLGASDGADVTCTSASPGVVTWTSHGLSTGDPVIINGGTAPTGLATNTIYYVRYASANTFTLAATPGGSAINTSSTGSGLKMTALRLVGSAGAFGVHNLENVRKLGLVICLNDIPLSIGEGRPTLALRYTVTGSNLGGTWNANLVVDTQDGRKFYPSGYSIS